MLLLLSPAKKLTDECSSGVTCTEPKFLKEAQELVRGLKKLSAAQLSELMNLSDVLADLNHKRFRAWKTVAGQSGASVFAFQGDVYASMEAASFSKSELEFAQNHLRILSGLYGVLRPLDWMHPYRLEMGTRFENSHGKNLYQFWGDKINTAVQAQLNAQGDNVLVNLASNEYFKSVKDKQLNATLITPVFKEKRGDNFKVMSFFAKKARGLMARFVITNKITNPQDMKDFEDNGYTFRKGLSAERTWVFARSGSVGVR